MNKCQEKALGRFIGIIGKIHERLAEIQAFTDDHMGCNPDDINWADVGSAGWFLDKLTEMTDLIHKRGEYEESEEVSEDE